MRRIAWSADSIRPYESLLALLMRFIGLNRPNLAELAKELGISIDRLDSLDLTFGRSRRRQMNLESFRSRLGATPEQWAHATLDWAIAESGTVTFMRFCPFCLKDGYHSVIFQLCSIQECPIHRVGLLTRCPKCRKESKTTVECLNLAKPLTCPGCSIPLVPAEALVNPPRLGALPEIAEIAEWFLWAAKLPQATVGAAIPSIRWKCLELAGSNHAPAALQLVQGSWEQYELVTSTYNEAFERVKSTKRRESTNELQRNDRLNEIYWRSLERALPKVERPSSKCSPCLDALFQLGSAQCGEGELALLMPRYTMEGRDVVEWLGRRRQRAPTRSEACVYLRSEHLVGARLEITPTLHCSQRQLLWLKDRSFCEYLRGVFATAHHRARAIIPSNKLRLEDLSNSLQECQPCCLGLFNPENGLEFWSLRTRLEPKWNGLDRRIGLSPDF